MNADRFARVVIAIGALLVFLCAALRTWGAAYLRTAIVHDTAQHSNALVVDGPFRYTRNPLYLANLPMAAGIGVLASVSGFIFLVLANWIFVYRLILREEESLRQSQGESYRAYCELVPRFWPSLRPRVPPGNPKGVFAVRKHHKPRQSLNDNTAGVREREDANRTRVVGSRNGVEGVVENTRAYFAKAVALVRCHCAFCSAKSKKAAHEAVKTE